MRSYRRAPARASLPRRTTRSNALHRFAVEYYRLCRPIAKARATKKARDPRSHGRVRPAAAHRAPEGGVAGLRSARRRCSRSCSTMPRRPARSVPASTHRRSPASCSRRSCSTCSRRRSAARRRSPTATTPPRASGTSCSTASAPTPAATSAVVVAVDLAALHHEPHLLGHGDVGERVAGHGDDVGEQAGLEAAAVVDVDQLGGRRWSRRGWPASGVMPAVDEREQLLGVAAVGDRGRVGAARDPHARARWPC